MMKDFFKKISKQQEPEDLDTGYDSDYYGNSYNRQPADARAEGTGESGEENGRSTNRAEGGYDRGFEEASPRDYREPVTYRITYATREAKTAEPEVQAPVNAGTLYFVPETYKDGREEIVEALAKSHVVVLNVKLLATADTVRLFDYIMGAVQVLEADMTRLNAQTVLLAPKDLEVTEDDLRTLLEDRQANEEAEASDDSDEDSENYDDLPDALSDEDLIDIGY